MPHDALGGLSRARGDPGPRGGRRLVRAPPGGGTGLTPARRAALAFGATLLLTALTLAALPDAAAGATHAAAFGLALLGLAAGFTRPAFATLALAGVAPLLSGLPRLLGDADGACLLPALAIAVLGSAGARRLADAKPSPLPRRLVTFAWAFLVLAAGSATASAVRGETLYLLLRGRTAPVLVNGLGMTAASRTRDAFLVFLGLVLLFLALDAFARLALEPDGRSRLLLFATVGGALALVLSALERALPVDGASRWAELHRRAGTFTDPNALGVGIGLLVPLFAAALVTRGAATDRFRRAAAAAGLVAAPFALESSGSRTGLLLLGASALAATVGLARRRRLPPLAIAAALAALLGAGLVVWRTLPRGGAIAAGGLWDRLGAGLSARSFADVANHRLTFWRGAFEMTADEPLSGVGLAGFPYEFPISWEKRHGPIAVTDSATNALLDMAAECGLPGLLLALFAVVPLLVRAFDAAFSGAPLDPVTRAAGAAVAGLFVACLTGSHFRFFEIALLTGLVAGFLLVPSPDAPGEETSGWQPGRTARLVAAAGLLASALAALPTRRPEAVFRASRWAGIYRARAGAPGFYWASPRAYLELAPAAREVALRFMNARPDGAPVTVRADVDGGAPVAVDVPGGGEIRDLRVSVPEGGRVLRLVTSPSFVPRDATGSTDRRRLAVRVSSEGL